MIVHFCQPEGGDDVNLEMSVWILCIGHIERSLIGNQLRDIEQLGDEVQGAFFLAQIVIPRRDMVV